MALQSFSIEPARYALVKRGFTKIYHGVMFLMLISITERVPETVNLMPNVVRYVIYPEHWHVKEYSRHVICAYFGVEKSKNRAGFPCVYHSINNQPTVRLLPLIYNIVHFKLILETTTYIMKKGLISL